MIAALATLLAALGAVLGLIVEGRRLRRQLGITNMWRLIETWDHADMRRLRARLARRLLTNPHERTRVGDDGIDVLNTFELLGFLVRSKGLGLEDAWSNFSVWANSWWYVYERGIERLRAEDLTVYQDYAALVEKFLDYESEQRSISKDAIRPSDEILTKFLKSEYRLLARIRQRDNLAQSLSKLLPWAKSATPSRRPSHESAEGSGLAGSN